VSNKKEILESLKKSIETWNIELAKKSAKQAVEADIDPAEAVEKGLGKGMEVISQLFDEAKIYLPQVLAASHAMEAALKILEPAMAKGKNISRGTVVIATVHGDIHEIGKNVVAAMLRGAGYRVIDLGRDVPVEKFVEAAKENNADVVGASALMTTTCLVQKDIVDMLKEEKVSVKTIFGGAPCNAEWVKSIGGDVYCPSGAEAVAMVNKLVKG
jgi:corrinoid protein of di/trimethylamine methyltransferase